VRILFVYPNLSRQTTPQIGISSLLGVLRGHNVKLFDITPPPFDCSKDLQEFVGTIQSFQPDLILVSCRSNEWGFVQRIIELAFPVPTVVGGIHPTVSPEEVIAYAPIIVRGEGELAVKDLVNNWGKDLTKIPNLWVKKRGKIYKNDVRPLISNLDELPMPAWDLFYPGHYRGSYIKALFSDIKCVGTFEASRGCPYSCTYCSNGYLQNLYKGKGHYHRKKSPERVVKEITEFKKLYQDCNFLYFVDETFMIEEAWLKEFSQICDKTPFVFMTRPEMVTEKKIKLIKKAGGRAVSIGIESGNEKFREEVLGRKMSNKQIIEAFHIARVGGLSTYSFNMVGLPFETRDDILSTIELNKKIKPDKAQFTTFFPLKGTELFDTCVKEGYLKEGKYPGIFFYYKDSILELPNFKKGELNRWVKRAEKELN